MKWLADRTGFTLAELLLSSSILAFFLCGILLVYINIFISAEFSRAMTGALNGAQAKMEEVKKTNFDNLSSFNGNVFNVPGFAASEAKGSVAINDTSYSDLKTSRVSVCFKTRRRVIGEDKNLNGALDAGEDANANGRLDCPVELVTLIAR